MTNDSTSHMTSHMILGAGQVGRTIADQLRQRGERATVVSRSGAAVDGADSRAADLTDPVAVKDAVAGADVVYQCAQPPYHRWPQEFPALQRSIIDAAAATGAVLVAAENMYAYGPVATPMREDMPLAATTRKGAVRAAMSRELEQAHRDGRVRAVAARAADFYGPGVTASMLGERFFRPLLVGGKVEVVGDVRRLHTVTYLPDLAAAMVRLGADPDAWGRAWHVPNAPTVTTAELVALAGRAAGVMPRSRRVGAWQLRLAGLFNRSAGEVVEMMYEFEEDFVVDDGAYAARYGDAPTPLAEGLAATVAWYRAV